MCTSDAESIFHHFPPLLYISAYWLMWRSMAQMDNLGVKAGFCKMLCHPLRNVFFRLLKGLFTSMNPAQGNNRCIYLSDQGLGENSVKYSFSSDLSNMLANVIRYACLKQLCQLIGIIKTLSQKCVHQSIRDYGT